MTVTLRAFSTSMFSFWNDTFFPLNIRSLLHLNTSSKWLLAQSKYPVLSNLLVFKCATAKQKFLFLFPSQSFDFFIQDLTLVGGEKRLCSCFFFDISSRFAPFCSLNEVEQCTVNTSWFTFKKQNNQTGQKLKT